ncbi:helix-turn-helix transcriptional regulator [Paenibacillus spiritus]|uniref:Helix-turn-helix transcriptional regulator n=1 Tax=Paenibacillus spiritus TaxID=2496557 RepID=A0A5J5G8P7_9BACL|nr:MULTISPECIES: helix-turn-helix transcriptional regulator [Paenibacillus]KAA9003982.1 helix-turn-helix transcriptional regulator [Paenibacillus spiritus]
MTVTDRLARLMNERGINRSELAKGAGIPYTTIVSLFEKGAENIKLSTMRKLAAYFGKTLDELVEEDEPAAHAHPDLSDEEILTLAAHQVGGHTEPMTPEKLAQIRLALRIALAKDNS